MEQYHGTNSTVATNIVTGLIDISFGGGEIGKGFYTGDKRHEAFNWAWVKYDTDNKVVKLTVDDNQLLTLRILLLDYIQTLAHRQWIKNAAMTRTFCFGYDLIWAPVVGKPITNFNQFKYETKTAESYLNSSSIVKVIL